MEKGFRFIKDKSFRVSEVYLKKPQRIEALSMIMVLTLMIYSVAEWKLRNDKTIISSISVADIVFDVYMGKWNYRAIPKVKT